MQTNRSMYSLELRVGKNASNRLNSNNTVLFTCRHLLPKIPPLNLLMIHYNMFKHLSNRFSFLKFIGSWNQCQILINHGEKIIFFALLLERDVKKCRIKIHSYKYIWYTKLTYRNSSPISSYVQLLTS